MSYIHCWVYRLTGGTLGARFGGPALLLTTRGRKTKAYRTTPLLYLEDGDHWVVVASNGGADFHPDWWLNLKANPTAWAQIKGRVMRVLAREVSEDERRRLWPLLVNMCGLYETYRTRTSRKIPIVSLESDS
ncbi:MAG: nitroreductase family deazaflavin-dependent oxidoreductase [Deltaproteobacteria bacterium]|nr:nitroreductase family deazaflavin-dependent oxidoreductase [Deltaproteobacteria bacterium]